MGTVTSVAIRSVCENGVTGVREPMDVGKWIILCKDAKAERYRLKTVCLLAQAVTVYVGIEQERN
jgi:hypothetical protein